MGSGGKLLTDLAKGITLTNRTQAPSTRLAPSAVAIRAGRRRPASEALAEAGQVGGSLAGFVKRIERLPPQNSRAKGSEVSKIGRIDFRYQG